MAAVFRSAHSRTSLAASAPGAGQLRVFWREFVASLALCRLSLAGGRGGIRRLYGGGPFPPVARAARREKFFKRKTAFRAVHDRVCFGAGKFGQLHGLEALAVQADVASPSLIPVLCLPSGPTAVRRLIVARWVDAVERMARTWLWAHVGGEGREIAKPSGANGHSLAAVVTVQRRARIGAPLLHVLPSLVERMGGFERHRPLCHSVALYAIGADEYAS